MRKISLSILSLAIILIAGCGDKEINSNWRQSEINIDGNQSDWEGKLHYLSDERAVIGIANDNEYLFLCIATNDTANMFQFFSTGFTVWLESKNVNEKIGIQYPIRSADMRKMVQSRSRGNAGERPDFKVRLNEFKSLQTEIQIINRDNFPLTVYPLNNELGLQVDIGSQMGLLVYEMKVPLAKDLYGGHNLKSAPGDILKIGFESGDFQLGNFGEGGSPPGSGMGRRGIGRPEGNNRRFTNFPTMEKIDFEIEVKLASQLTHSN
jgi:hypothetical protein